MLFITLGLVPMAFMDGFVAFLLWIFTTVMSPGNWLGAEGIPESAVGTPYSYRSL